MLFLRSGGGSAAFLIVLAPFLLIYFAYQIVQEIRFLLRYNKCTKEIPGEVTSVDEYSRGRHGSYFTANIKYYTAENHAVFYETEHRYRYDQFHVGQTVTMCVDPDNEYSAAVQGEASDAVRTIVVDALLILFLIFLMVLWAVS